MFFQLLQNSLVDALPGTIFINTTLFAIEPQKQGGVPNFVAFVAVNNVDWNSKASINTIEVSDRVQKTLHGYLSK